MGYNLLKGKRGIIFGALNDMSIAWKVAEMAHAEGAQFTLSNTHVACRMGSVSELAEKTGATVIPADATNLADLENVIKTSTEVLGGKIDFILHSIGMSLNVRKKRLYTIWIITIWPKRLIFPPFHSTSLFRLPLKWMP